MELKRDSERLSKWKTEHLNQLLDLLDLPRGKEEAGTKVRHPPTSMHRAEAPTSAAAGVAGWGSGRGSVPPAALQLYSHSLTSSLALVSKVC